MHAIDECLTFLALAASHVELAIFAHFLRARQCLQSCYDVATRVARHHHIERIHCLETVALAETEGAGRYHHFVDGGSPLIHTDGEIVQLTDVGFQREVDIADECHFERCLARLRGGKRETSEGVGQTSVDRT